MALDLTNFNSRDDNNNLKGVALDLRTVSSHDEISDTDQCSNPDLDLTWMNLMCLAHLQETAAILRKTLLSAKHLHGFPEFNKTTKKPFRCDFEGCEKVTRFICLTSKNH